MIINRNGFKANFLEQALVSFWGDPGSTFSVCLFKNDVIPDGSLDTDQFVEADFVGYARASFGSSTYGPVFINGAGDAQMNGDTAYSWLFTGPTPQTVFGYFILSDDEDNWAFAERTFGEAGLVLAVPGTTFSLLPRYVQGDWRPAP